VFRGGENEIISNNVSAKRVEPRKIAQICQTFQIIVQLTICTYGVTRSTSGT
jgi:hypothetical protein